VTQHFRPEPPEGEFNIRVTCARCRTEVQLTLFKHEIGSDFHECPACHRNFIISPNLETWSPLGMAAMVALVVLTMPLLILDRMLWKAFNEASGWLQKTLMVNRYVLALVGFGVGALSFLVLDNTLGAGILDAVFWTFSAHRAILWCWHKAQTSGEEEAEMRSLADAEAIASARLMRLGRLVVVPPVGLFLLVAVGSGWGISMFIMSSGYYLLDTEHVPPSLRGVFDAFSSFTHSPA